MIKIFVIDDTSPEIIRLQVASFRKYLRDDFEFILFNNENLAVDREKSKEVSNTCRSLSIQMIEPQRDSVLEAALNEATDEHRPCFNKEGRYSNIGEGHNYVLQWTWENVVSKERGPIGMFHSDVFLMEPIRLTDRLQEYTLCFCPQNKGPLVNYMWETIVLADMSKLPDPETMCWFSGWINGQLADTGGYTHYYLTAHPEIKCLHIHHATTFNDPTLNFNDPAQKYHEARYGIIELGGKKLLHYLSGSRWYTNDVEYHRKKFVWAQKMTGITSEEL
jgi:hypothetical protein